LIVKFWWLFYALCRYIWIGFIKFIIKRFRMRRFSFFDCWNWFLLNILFFNIFRRFYGWKNLIILFQILLNILILNSYIILNRWSFIKSWNFRLFIELANKIFYLKFGNKRVLIWLFVHFVFLYHSNSRGSSLLKLLKLFESVQKLILWRKLIIFMLG
jgi:hypothetical protein